MYQRAEGCVHQSWSLRIKTRKKTIRSDGIVCDLKKGIVTCNLCLLFMATVFVCPSQYNAWLNEIYSY